LRITRAQLLEAARREVEARAEGDGLVAAYAIGSVVHDQALLGGAADIDLVLVHDHAPLETREIVRLSDEVHLDIAHHDRQRYAQPRLLRVDPWLGPAIYDPVPLYDPQHLFEWAQAAARGQFLRADHRLARARSFLQRGRAAQASLDAAAPWIATLMRAALAGANAIASLAGPPAAGRRVLAILENAAAAAGCPEAHAGLLRLVGLDASGPHDFADWVASWARTFDVAAPLSTDPALQPERRDYYLRGFQAWLEAGQPHNVLHPMLSLWERSLTTLTDFAAAEEHLPAWKAATAALGLSADAAPQRFLELDAYLDHLETFLEHWSARHGA